MTGARGLEDLGLYTQAVCLEAASLDKQSMRLEALWLEKQDEYLELSWCCSQAAGMEQHKNLLFCGELL